MSVIINPTAAGGGSGDAVTVNGAATTDVDLDNATPAAPAGGANVKWQSTGASPSDVSAYLDVPDLAQALRRKTFYASDFFNIDVDLNDPFLLTVIAAGTIVAPNAGLVTAHHPGVIKIRSSTTTNSGGRAVTDVAGGLLLGGGEVFEGIVNFTTLTNTTVRVGFHDSTTSADAVDGAYFELSAGTLKGKTASNSTRSTTGTTFTPTAGTWYRLRVTVNSNATQVNFDVFDDAGTNLLAANLAANIPTASGREVAAGLVATNSGTTATDLLHLDYQAFYQNDRAFTR